MDDLISRQAAIDEIEAKFDEIYKTKQAGATFPHDDFFQGMAYAADIVKNIPSAQPEIIRCKDCKNSEHWYWDKRRCFLWAESGIGVFDDGFCNYAERRQDDERNV